VHATGDKGKKDKAKLQKREQKKVEAKKEESRKKQVKSLFGTWHIVYRTATDHDPWQRLKRDVTPSVSPF